MFKKTDLQLVLALQKDGRASYSELAEKLGITASTVAKRIRFLLESGAITIRALPNPEKIGLGANALIFIRVDPTKLDKAVDKLVDNFHVNLVQTIFGRFDLMIAVYFSTWDLLHAYTKELSLTEGVLEIETHYVQDIKKRYELIFGSDLEKCPPLKDNDWKLIKALVKDGRSNVKDLADRLGMNISIVSRRISALLSSNIIKISAIPTPKKFGFAGKAFILMTINATKAENICHALYDFEEIHLIMTMHNAAQIIIGVQTVDNTVLHEIIKKRIAPIDGIYNTETFILAEVKKRYYGWFLEE